MTMFAIGLATGILLSSLFMWGLATRLQHDRDLTEEFLRGSRDSLSSALKGRNDKLFEMEKELKRATEVHHELSGALQQLRTEHEKVLSSAVDLAKALTLSIQSLGEK